MSLPNFSIRLASAATRLANRALDQLLGIHPHLVLNAGQAVDPRDNPALELRRLAAEMRASALDPATYQVDYSALAGSDSYRRFREFAQALPACKVAELGDRAGQLAFWVNLYNALILHGVIHHQVTDSVRSDLGFFRRVAYNVGGMRFSADDIEHGVLRGNARHPYLPFPQFAADDPRRAASIRDPDPRIHFALVCGAQSCPPIAAYDAEGLDGQLDQAAAAFIRGSGTRFDSKQGHLWVSRIFKWYADDFGGRAEVRRLLANYLDEDRDRLRTAQLRYLPYDWTLNGAAFRGARAV